MNNKARNTLIVVLMFAVAILFLIIGFLLGIRTNNNEESLKKTEQVDIDEIEVANNLFSKITNLYMCGDKKFDLGADHKLTFNELDNDYVNRLVLNSLLVDNKIDIFDDVIDTINVADFRNEFLKVFGNMDSFKTPQTLYIMHTKFDLNGDSYIGSSSVMGCGGEYFNEYYLNDYELKNDKFSLYVYLLYSVNDDEYVLDNNISLPLEDNIQTYTKQEILNNYKSQLIKYKFTFNIENNNYVFNSIELAN